MNSAFVISLDFELFWGVCDSQTLSVYGNNVSGEWLAIPKILEIFKKYKISATWATVGMAMCKDYRQWSEIRPNVTPAYSQNRLSSYQYGALAKEHPSLFFGRPLIEEILLTPRQEIGGHSYSHFYTDERGVTVEQFSADLVCAEYIANEIGVKLKSFVFPRNQCKAEFVSVLSSKTYKCFRGNPEHWLYKDGHKVLGGMIGKSFRLLDQYIPFSGDFVSVPSQVAGMFNIPASSFLRPYNDRLNKIDFLRLARLKGGMLAAAQKGKVFHLWWHPHNFGVNIDENLLLLEDLLRYYLFLNHEYGMCSMTMKDLVCGDEF
jgi:peptidoglycan/xylan/chitin deacetylase (PgdA/CDA1 family)